MPLSRSADMLPVYWEKVFKTETVENCLLQRWTELTDVILLAFYKGTRCEHLLVSLRQQTTSDDCFLFRPLCFENQTEPSQVGSSQRFVIKLNAEREGEVCRQNHVHNVLDFSATNR